MCVFYFKVLENLGRIFLMKNNMAALLSQMKKKWNNRCNSCKQHVIEKSGKHSCKENLYGGCSDYSAYAIRLCKEKNYYQSIKN